MTMKKKMLISLAVVLGIMLVSSVSIMAANSAYGSKDDPLVTQSYLAKIFSRDIEAEISSAIDEGSKTVKAELEQVVQEYEDKIDEKLAPSIVISTSDIFSVVTLNSGQKLQCGVGTEIMLRVGSAQSNGSDYPALVDSTTGTSLSSGTTMSANHMYVVTIKNNGITAAEDGTRVLVRGDYKVN